MSEQKRFKKSKINSNDHKAMEIGAKVVKGVGGLLTVTAMLVVNKENIKVVGKEAVKVIKKL